MFLGFRAYDLGLGLAATATAKAQVDLKPIGITLRVTRKSYNYKDQGDPRNLSAKHNPAPPKPARSGWDLWSSGDGKCDTPS